MKIKNFEFITGKDPSSFAHFTITQRLPGIIDKIISKNNFHEKHLHRLEQLKSEIPDQPIKNVETYENNDQVWQKKLGEFKGYNWLEVPFFLAETYFYRRILEAINYFASKHKPDPFFTQKMEDIEENSSFMEQLVFHQNDLLSSGELIPSLQNLIMINLWGNQSDLSQLHWEKKSQPEITLINQQLEEKVIINDSGKIKSIFKETVEVMDFILDNAGLELFTDLLLADFLLQRNLVNRIHLHVKSYPTFVSDATTDDIDLLLNKIRPQEFPERIRTYINSGRIDIFDHDFWVLPLFFYELPADLEKILAKSDLILLKGDANYRRLLGDRSFPFEIPVEELVTYTPAPVLAVRSLKSEIITGLPKEKEEKLNQIDPKWLVDGNFGMIQWIPKFNS